MKKIIFLFFLFSFSIPFFCFSYEYLVEVEDKGLTFQMKIRTFQNQSSMSPLKLTNIQIEKPTFSQDGIIDLKVIKDLHGKQIMATGPNSGIFTFRKGFNLPQGRYCLIIDDEDYGFLYIYEDEVFFEPINFL